MTENTAPQTISARAMALAAELRAIVQAMATSAIMALATK